MGEVREEWDVQPAQPALLPRGVHPGEVGEVGVNGAGHNLEKKEYEISQIIFKFFLLCNCKQHSFRLDFSILLDLRSTKITN